MTRFFFLLAAITVSGCGVVLDLDPPDPSAALLDAAKSDGGTAGDAGPVEIDAGSPRDAGSPSDDGGPSDASTMCVPMDEMCNGDDDDCDGSTDESLARSCTTACGTGTQTCSAGSWGDCSAPVGEVEICNGLDDDCDGVIDGGSVCSGFTSIAHGGSIYLFMSTADGRLNWVQARQACRARGYRLVTLETATEAAWVAMTAFDLVDDDWLIGLNDRADEGVFVWDSGVASSYRRWAGGGYQPDNSGGVEHCVSIVNGDESWETRSDWNDMPCSAGGDFYICELR